MPDPYASEGEVADWYYYHYAYWYAAYTTRRRRHGWPFHNRIPF